MSDTPQRLILGISGASGVIYGIRMLQILQEKPIETHLVISKSAEITIAYETDWKAAKVKERHTKIAKFLNLKSSIFLPSHIIVKLLTSVEIE